MSELKYWVWLAELFSRGSDKPFALLDTFETPQRIFEASEEELSKTGILNPSELARVTRHSLERSEFILKECQRFRMSVVPWNDPVYPERLRHIYGAPTVLYVYGNLAGLDQEPTIGVVGTRRSSDYGNELTDILCYQLASAGMTVISGCATGIDAHAHLGTLKAGGRTVGVLGCSLNVDYPAENNGLKTSILKNGGALISEIPPGSASPRNYFPTRNRIISGLSMGVVVTEAPERSGALISLNHALDQGRDVFCVPPHDLRDPIFRGVVKPLRDGAIAVYDADDILSEYYGEYSHTLSADKAMIEFVRKPAENTPTQKAADGKTSKPKKKAEPPKPKEEVLTPELEGNVKKIYDALTEEPQYVNDLARITELSLAELLSTLTELEIDGLVTSYSGQRYSKS